jgi:membrane fusion protein, multidrug efflux system
MTPFGRAVAWIAGLAVATAVIFPLLSTGLTNKPKTAEDGDHGHGGHHRGAGGPQPVLVAKAKKSDVPVYVEGVGTGLALNSVLIRSQVDGTLNELNFVEGQQVKAGDLIAKIDPRLYQAAVDQDVAKKNLDEATLANAKRDMERYRQLALTKAVTQQQYDTQVATVAQDEAQIAIDQGTIDSAKTTLSYTTITSPISGRTGIRNVDVGNLIHATDTTGIVTVSQIQPMSVIFNVPQQELPRINKASLLNQLDVQALDGTGKSVIDHGVLAVVNNTIDSTTGTVKLKANFDNKLLQLWPGIFTNVRLRVETLKDAIIIPVAALQRGPSGTFVFIATQGDKAQMRPVTIGQQDDSQAVVTAGLQPDETVITSGFQKLTDGADIQPSTDMAATKADDTPGLHKGGVSPVAPAGAGTTGTPPPPRRHGGGHRQSAGE